MNSIMKLNIKIKKINKIACLRMLQKISLNIFVQAFM